MTITIDILILNLRSHLLRWLGRASFGSMLEVTTATFRCAFLLITMSIRRLIGEGNVSYAMPRRQVSCESSVGNSYWGRHRRDLERVGPRFIVFRGRIVDVRR